jgi:hypothetical protein
VEGAADVHEDWKYVNVFLTEAMQSQQKGVSEPLERVLKSRTVDGQAALGPEAEAAASKGSREEIEETDEEAERVVVLASGNLALVYGAALDERITLEQFEDYFPGLLDGLAQHEGVGFVMIRSREQGPVVIGARGRYYLADDRVEGENPLAGFGTNAAEHLRRTDSFPDAPDILVNSFYKAETNEVAAFEELIGSHGGLGGYQTHPFLLYPSEWELDDGHLVGAAAVYHQFKSWLGMLQLADSGESSKE